MAHLTGTNRNISEPLFPLVLTHAGRNRSEQPPYRGFRDVPPRGALARTVTDRGRWQRRRRWEKHAQPLLACQDTGFRSGGPRDGEGVSDD